MEPNLSILAFFINGLIAVKALTMVRRTHVGWLLASLAITLQMRSVARLDPILPLQWQGLSLSSFVLAFALCAWASLRPDSVARRGPWLMAVPGLSVAFGLLDAWLKILPEGQVVKDYPPANWAHWPAAALVLSLLVIAPRLRNVRREEWAQYQVLLPGLLFLSLISGANARLFHLPPAVAIEAWCELGVLVLARIALRNESLGRIPMLLVMLIVPTLAGVWVTVKLIGSEAPLAHAAAVAASTTAFVAAVIAVLLREEVERHLTRFFSPSLQAAQERALRLEKEVLAARETLRSTEREAMLGEVVLSLAHQIKNPLGPMKGYAQMLEQEVGQVEPESRRERMRKGLRIILEEAERIDRQVKDLMTFAGRKTPRRENVEVNRLLERAVHFVSPEGRGIAVELDLSPLSPTVVGDPDRLHEAFLNLILNAVEAMSDVGRKRLRVSSRAADDGLTARIADTGAGIAAEDLDSIYEPFFSRRRGGFGLGLAIVRSVINECGGRINCQSEVDVGTEFTVWLPAGKTEEQENA